MQLAERKRALACAVEAARAAGALMRQNRHSTKRISEATQHDIKLELDVRCQRLIERTLQRQFPAIAILGEEGIRGEQDAPARWVIDPIDGTVNFTYGIPHACVSIAMQLREPAPATANRRAQATDSAGYTSVLGVVYDPFCDELWTGLRGQPARLNGKPIRVSRRKHLEESIVSIGFAKKKETLEMMLPVFNRLVHRVRKIRMMGAAALALVYVASGRMDAYVEAGVRLWDIAAGGLILECAGGDFCHAPLADQDHSYSLTVSNGLLRGKLQALMR